MPQEFNPNHFTNQLKEIIGRELRKRAHEFTDEEITALAIDCHPWHGIIELCFLTPQDIERKWELAGWKYFQFTDPTISGGWEEARELCLVMQEEWIRCFHEGDSAAGRAQAKQVADQFFKCCAAALKSDDVQQALKYYVRSSDFEVWVGNPDDSNNDNYCDKV